MYAMVALCLAYFQFRKQEPGLISASCQLLIQGQTRRSVGHAIDIIAVFATVFGVATSLGFGAIQISGGLSYLFPKIPNTVMTQLVLIAVVTALYLLSAQTGLQRGIKYLSHVNMVLAIALMGFLLFLGPTTFIMEVFTSALGDYLHNLPKMSLYLAPFDDSRWIQNWTLFYWAWWIAWAPFVGTFIARISRGRTVREFVLGVLFVGRCSTVLRIVVFNWGVFARGTAISLDMFQHAGLKQVIEGARERSAHLYGLLEQFPMGAGMSLHSNFPPLDDLKSSMVLRLMPLFMVWKEHEQSKIGRVLLIHPK